ncbi:MULTISPECIES: META domain-containing protein [Rhodococcus]|uniref:META domain-containing protein n=1 Tax=Rhodococcus oxybenzonivorans TaxID=1990687 RepID=A0AAE4UX46_9NOCA|nr:MULTISPECIES: META domain-containing protein [Rhodococcus]MDV7242176.1 META domain-containing protein [Rhodococcus oxybenzonivorans]MDV7264643.1 META domain-containing protein [Rhodococcus oxybenzonivorans]MDV7276329.1 META domain-containing protein [Rhodococcus oxybenzonivorans]MDV7331664.1 META domain-containing protein [Rhodococcus oxybenzonivorans]MDV7343886.1 META domain-containing protein [Rhodococcus oxybenzonivorans]
MRATAIVLGLLTFASLTSCGGDAPTAAPDPVGRTFVSTSVEGDPIPGGGPLVLGFTDPGRLSFDAGCNQGSADVDLSGGKVVAGPLAMTLMACPGEAAGADAWVAGLLDAQPSWTLGGDTLTLTRPMGSVTLTDEKVVRPDRPVVGTTWTVTALISPDAVTTTAALERTTPQLLIAGDGSASGFTGCNRMTGTADVRQSSIEFGPWATTRIACPPDVSEVERAVLAALTGETSYSVHSDSLRLVNADGIGLTLRAS